MKFIERNSVVTGLIIFVLLAALTARGQDGKFESLPQEGQTFIHDPSTIIKDGSDYYVFGTGRGITVKMSPDLIHWTNCDRVFETPPAWTTIDVPNFHGAFWAPDIIHMNGKFYLYYAVSTIGKQVSAIGLATNPTLDQSATNYAWTDCGEVIRSTNGGDFNTIDPSVMRDDDGKLWMAFGSYWRGIYVTELDSTTGLHPTNSPFYHVAWNYSIEASCLTRHDDYYYLFVNWGSCCQGTNSTYEVRIGRSKKVAGPYLDKDGKDLVDGGGSKFLQTTGRFFGPGHIGILKEGGTIWFSYHYYDAATQGKSRLGLGKLGWTKDGWPVPAK